MPCVSERLNVLYEKNWTHLVHEQLRKFETNVVAATKVEGYDGKDLLDSDRQWSFSGALLYSVTVITTIGELAFANAGGSQRFGAMARCCAVTFRNLVATSDTCREGNTTWHFFAIDYCSRTQEHSVCVKIYLL